MLEDSTKQSQLEKAILKSKEKEEKRTIGVQKEKILHRVLKYYLCEDDTNHEIMVGHFYADVKQNEQIFEIQTQNFNALRKKLDFFLPNYEVCIVYPTSRNKVLHNINAYGELLKIQKSPKKGTPFQILVEMYKIKTYLKNPHLSFLVVYLDMDEYRTIVPKQHIRSKGYIRYKQVPKTLVGEYALIEKSDYIQILEEYNLRGDFTVNDFSKIFKLSYAKASSAVQVLNYLEIIQKKGKIGRKNLWTISKNEN